MAFFSFPAQVNERAARLVAAVVATTATVALVSGATWLVPVLAVGFLLRVGWGPKLSPLGRFASGVAPKLWDVHPVAGPPKRFAQGIGAIVTIAATACFAVGSVDAGRALVAMIVLFATLEAAFAFCLGCRIYAVLQRIGVFPPDACVDCAPMGR